MVGHLATWNGEAARSLEAHAAGREHTCIASDALDDEYNGAAADERRTWTVDQVWAEYEATHDRLEAAVQSMPPDRWQAAMLFPWNERGTIRHLVDLMTDHEKVDHCDLIVRATA